MAETQKKRAQAFTPEERAAMKERAAEQKAAASRADEAEAAAEVLAKIAEMPDADRVLAEGVHEIVAREAPSLTPRTWYGMPAYAKEGKVLFFFQPAKKFKTRYSTLGFNDPSNLDDGEMWPVAFALTEWTAEVEARIAALVRKAAS